MNFEKFLWSDINDSDTQEKFNIIHDLIFSAHNIFINQNVNEANKLLEDIKGKENLFQEGRGFSLEPIQ